MSADGVTRSVAALQNERPQRREAIVGIILLGAVSVFLMMSLALYAIGADEGVALSMGMAIRDGWLPYRDFYENRTPALHYLISALFALVPSLWIGRAALLGVHLFCIWLVRRQAQELGGPQASFWATVFYLCSAMLFQGYMILNEPFISALLLLSLWLGWSRGRSGWAAGAAVTAFWFKQTALAPAAVIVAMLLAQASSGRQRLAVLGGGMVALGLPALLFWRAGMAQAMWAQTVMSNVQTVSDRWSGLSEFVKTCLDVLGTSGMLWILCGAGLAEAIVPAGSRPRAMALTGAVIGALGSAVFTPGSHYFLPLGALGSIAAGVGLVRLLDALPQPRHRIALIGILTVPLLAQAAVPALSVFKQGYLFHQYALARRIQALTAPGERILVLNHEPGYYFLAHRYPPVPTFFLLSVNDSPALEDRMIASLGHEVKIAVLSKKAADIPYGQRVRQQIMVRGTLIEADPGIGMGIWRVEDGP